MAGHTNLDYLSMLSQTLLHNLGGQHSVSRGYSHQGVLHISVRREINPGEIAHKPFDTNQSRLLTWSMWLGQ